MSIYQILPFCRSWLARRPPESMWMPRPHVEISDLCCVASRPSPYCLVVQRKAIFQPCSVLQVLNQSDVRGASESNLCNYESLQLPALSVITQYLQFNPLNSQFQLTMSSFKIPDGLPDIVAARFQEAKESGDLLAFDSTAAVLDVNGIPVTIPRSFLYILFHSFLYILPCSFLHFHSFLLISPLALSNIVYFVPSCIRPRSVPWPSLALPGITPRSFPYPSPVPLPIFPSLLPTPNKVPS